MFTGLIKELGQIEKIEANAEGRLITIKSNDLIKEIEIDDSVSINGACQTVIKKTDNSFSVQAVHVTLEKTNFQEMKVGDQVNMELALRLSDRLGGHIVQGHVNAVGQLVKIKETGKNYLVYVRVPKNLSQYILNEGSIALNGISLTVANFNIDSLTVEVSIIPHTWENTNLNKKKIGDKLNIEVDILAKYVENLMLRGKKENNSISEKWLNSKGFE